MEGNCPKPLLKPHNWHQPQYGKELPQPLIKPPINPSMYFCDLKCDNFDEKQYFFSFLKNFLVADILLY